MHSELIHLREKFSALEQERDDVSAMRQETQEALHEADVQAAALRVALAANTRHQEKLQLDMVALGQTENRVAAEFVQLQGQMTALVNEVEQNRDHEDKHFEMLASGLARQLPKPATKAEKKDKNRHKKK